MSGKMTDEDLEHELNQALSASRAERVRAHIAALTAERDEALRVAQQLQGVGDAIRERVKALEAECRGIHERRMEMAQLLAAIRQRAGDVDGMRQVWLSGAMDAVARYILGEDGPAQVASYCEEHGASNGECAASHAETHHG